MRNKYALIRSLIFMFVSFGVSVGAIATPLVVNPKIKLENGFVQLCSGQGNELSCAVLDVKSSVHPALKIIGLPSTEGAPYVWLAVGREFSAVCAAGENFVDQNLCIRLQVNIGDISISRVANQGVAFSFAATTTSIPYAVLQRKSARFTKAYSSAVNILHAYSKSNWAEGAPVSVVSKIKAQSRLADAVPSPDEEECRVRDNVEASTLSSSPPKVLSCDGGGGGVDDGGGDDGGGGSSDGGADAPPYNPYPGVDQNPGPPQQVIVTAPLPVWPADPTWCSLVGLYCNAPIAADDDTVGHASYCIAQELLAHDYCVNIFAVDPNQLPGSGSDYPGRYRMCVRNFLDSRGCYNY